MTIATKRKVIAQIFVCNGCCCGRADKGNPPIPLEELKAEFKRRKLIGKVQLTISGCLGPCDVLNVVALWLPEGMRWFGGLTESWQYMDLMDWAGACAAAGEALPLPAWLLEHEFNAMRETLALAEAV
jgi:predicted metal-binding protein